MELVETGMVIYTMCQKAHESLDYIMQLLKSQVETINAHGGNCGYQPKLYKDNLAASCKEENVAYKDASTKIRETTLDESCIEYLACLFV